MKAKPSPIVLLVFAYLFAYFIFYFIPTFFTAEKMLVFEGIPRAHALGIDYQATINAAKDRFMIPYSPFVKLFFNFLGSYSFTGGFLFITILSLISSVGSICLASIIFKKTDLKLFLFFLAVFLFSYSFLFEIERGQWNITTIFLVLASIYLSRKDWKIPALLLFAIAVSLKIYPLIFAPALIKDFRKLKDVAIMIMGVILTNSCMYLMMGWSHFKWFLRIMTKFAETNYSWVGNHSISSFVIFVNQESLKYLLFSIFLLILLSAFLILLKSKRPYVGVHFASILAIGACIIPSVSHDYKLTLLSFFIPFLFFSDTWGNKLQSGIRFLTAFFFFAIQYSYQNSDHTELSFVRNKLIILMIMSILILIDYFIEYRTERDLVITEHQLQS